MRSLPDARSGESIRPAEAPGKADGRKAVSWRAMLEGRAPEREVEASGEVEGCQGGRGRGSVLALGPAHCARPGLLTKACGGLPMKDPAAGGLVEYAAAAGRLRVLGGMGMLEAPSQRVEGTERCIAGQEATYDAGGFEAVTLARRLLCDMAVGDNRRCRCDSGGCGVRWYYALAQLY